MRFVVLSFLLFSSFFSFSQAKIGIIDRDSLRRHPIYLQFHERMLREAKLFDQNVRQIIDTNELLKNRSCGNNLDFNSSEIRAYQIKKDLVMKQYDSLLTVLETNLKVIKEQWDSQWQLDSAAYCINYNFEGLLFNDHLDVTFQNSFITKYFIQFLNERHVFITPE